MDNPTKPQEESQGKPNRMVFSAEGLREARPEELAPTSGPMFVNDDLADNIEAARRAAGVARSHLLFLAVGTSEGRLARAAFGLPVRPSTIRVIAAVCGLTREQLVLGTPRQIRREIKHPAWARIVRALSRKTKTKGARR